MSASDDERELIEANALFYRAFATSDLAAMDSLWSRRSKVACTHPSGETLRGRTEVMAAWRSLFGAGGAPPIVARDPEAYPSAAGGFVLCVEAVPGGTLAAINVFVREDGELRMVHHQAAPIARQQQRAPSKPPPKGPLLN
jgi:hypothetical protein